MELGALGEMGFGGVLRAVTPLLAGSFLKAIVPSEGNRVNQKSGWVLKRSGRSPVK